MISYENLRPVVKKHLILLPLFGFLLIILSPITYPIFFIITHWENIKEFTKEYHNEIMSCFVIPYTHYFGKNKNDR